LWSLWSCGTYAATCERCAIDAQASVVHTYAFTGTGRNDHGVAQASCAHYTADYGVGTAGCDSATSSASNEYVVVSGCGATSTGTKETTNGQTAESTSKG
jgi:hypothetical protein